eukprot:1499535-Pyramimonas_sp.AAC.1
MRTHGFVNSFTNVYQAGPSRSRVEIARAPLRARCRQSPWQNAGTKCARAVARACRNPSNALRCRKNECSENACSCMVLQHEHSNNACSEPNH